MTKLEVCKEILLSDIMVFANRDVHGMEEALTGADIVLKYSQAYKYLSQCDDEEMPC